MGARRPAGRGPPPRVLHLTHRHLLPPASLEGLTAQRRFALRTDVDVLAALRRLGYEVDSLALEDDLAPLQAALAGEPRPLVFNLLESFAGLCELDAHVVGFLELLGVSYTGCHPRGLVLARDKALSKMLLAHHGIDVPGFVAFPRGRRGRWPAGMDGPLIVKSLIDQGSAGISQASVVGSEIELLRRVAFVHERLLTDAIAEEYIEGRELTVGVLGNRRRRALPAWELCFDGLPPGHRPIATERAKKDLATQERWGLRSEVAADLPPEIAARIGPLSQRVAAILDLDGYARVDYRLAPDGRLSVLEANPNCALAADEDLAASAAHSGLDYDGLIQRIVRLALSRPTPAAARGATAG